MDKRHQWGRGHPAIQGLSASIVERLEATAGQIWARANSELTGFGAEGAMLLLLRSGRVRVHEAAHVGPRIRYYGAEAEVSTMLTNGCLIGQSPKTARLFADTDIEATTIARDTFEQLVESSAEFRALLHCSCRQRLADLRQHGSELQLKNYSERRTQTLKNLI